MVAVRCGGRRVDLRNLLIEIQLFNDSFVYSCFNLDHRPGSDKATGRRFHLQRNRVLCTWGIYSITHLQIRGINYQEICRTLNGSRVMYCQCSLLAPVG